MCDDADHTLESFRKNIVDKQVNDILCFVVGVKQEGVITASKCIDHNRGIYLVWEETKSEKCDLESKNGH